MATSSVFVEFHRFPDLPVELREMIWTLCLPHPRTCEIDVPSEAAVFDLCPYDDPSPCHLWHTTSINRSPPLISRVCQEARKVACRHGQLATFWPETNSYHPDNKFKPYIPRMNRTLWHDIHLDSVHMSWVPLLDSININHASDYPLDLLIGRVTQLTHQRSVLSSFWGLGRRSSEPNSVDEAPMVLRVDDLATRWPMSPKSARELAALKNVSEWLVVMRTIVVHCDARFAAHTGLFGRGGDARVQVVDVREHGLIEMLFRFAEQCEKNIPEIKVPQEFNRDGYWSEDAMATRLRARIMLEYHDQEVVESMRPAIMFRLCTQQCNDALVEAERESVQAEKEWLLESTRGRGGSPRGRGGRRGGGRASLHTAESRKRVWRRLQMSL